MKKCKFKDIATGRYFIFQYKPYLRISKGVTRLENAFSLYEGNRADFADRAHNIRRGGETICK